MPDKGKLRIPGTIMGRTGSGGRGKGDLRQHTSPGIPYRIKTDEEGREEYFTAGATIYSPAHKNTTALLPWSRVLAS